MEDYLPAASDDSLVIVCGSGEFKNKVTSYLQLK